MFTPPPSTPPMFMKSVGAPTPFLSAPTGFQTFNAAGFSSGASSAMGTSLLNNFGNILSTGLSAFTQFQASRSAALSSEFEADMLRMRSEQENLKAKEQALALRRKVQADMGKAQAMFASRGIRLGEGSALRALEQSVIEEQEDIDTLMFGAKQRQSELSSRATTRDTRAGLQRSMGFMEMADAFKSSAGAYKPGTSS